MKYPILILVSLCITLFADQTVWSYDLTYLPDGWSITGAWEFDSTGANIELEVWNGDDGANSIYTEMLHVPDGTDSLTLLVPQELSGGGCDGGYAFAVFEVTVNAGEPEILWSRSWNDCWGSDSEPISEVIDVYPGDSLSFYFNCTVSAGGGSFGYADLDWNMFDLELILHGDIQELCTLSWAGIKALYR